MSKQIADYGLSQTKNEMSFLAICCLRPTKARQIKCNLFAPASVTVSFPVLQMHKK